MRKKPVTAREAHDYILKGSPPYKHTAPVADVEVVNAGSIFMFTPLTERARDWIGANVQGDAQWLGGALAVEHRFAFDLSEGMVGDGLVVV